jgi:hypothetical protein
VPAGSMRETAKTRANSPTPLDPALTWGVLVSAGALMLPWLLPCPNVKTVEEAVGRMLTDSKRETVVTGTRSLTPLVPARMGGRIVSEAAVALSRPRP